MLNDTAKTFIAPEVLSRPAECHGNFSKETRMSNRGEMSLPPESNGLNGPHIAEILRPFRERIENIDHELAVLLADRFRTCCEVARIKHTEGISMMQPDRIAAVCASYAERGRALGVSPEFMLQLAGLIIGEACRLEGEIIDEPVKRPRCPRGTPQSWVGSSRRRADSG
jgi:chorismate mutase